MQGNQTVELTDKEAALTVAMDAHMGQHNCCGQLIFESWAAQPGAGKIGMIFRCLHCQRELIVAKDS